MNKTAMTIVVVVLMTLGAAAGGVYLASKAGWIQIGPPQQTMANEAQPGDRQGDATGACPHSIEASQCPFCTPSLIESMGFCHGHGVPEAFCHLCQPYMVTAFKAKGDWCAEHEAPESFCPVCSPGAGLAYLEGGEADTAEPEISVPGGCPHTLARENCPYCTPKLMVDMGFCGGHDTPEAFCAMCAPAIIPALKASGDWCAEHEQSETFCTVCSQAAKVAAGAEECTHDLTPEICPYCTPSLIVEMGFCSGHGVPEALCHLCHSNLIPAHKAVGDWCAEHEAVESVCPVCSPAFAPSGAPKELIGLAPSKSIQLVSNLEFLNDIKPGEVVCDTEQLQVRLAPNMSAKIGLEIEPVLPRKISETHTFNARLEYNRNRLAQLSSRAQGVIVEVFKQPGDTVQQGDALAVIDSVEIGNAKANLLQAITLLEIRSQEYERQQKLKANGATTEKSLIEAEAAFKETGISRARALQALLNLGLSESQVEQVIAQQDTSSQWELTAPFDGTVIDRLAVQGEVVNPNHTMFRLADTGVMWAWIDVYENDAAWVRESLPILFSSNSLRGDRFKGTIDWVNTELDTRTRTLRARVSLDNADGRLRANMFGRAEVMFSPNRPGIVVSKDAVQWEGCCHVVFVKQSDMLYTPRKVRLGHEFPNAYVVESGLLGGEEIVTVGSFLLKTEIMKGSIGAGCCEVNLGA